MKKRKNKTKHWTLHLSFTVCLNTQNCMFELTSHCTQTGIFASDSPSVCSSMSVKISGTLVDIWLKPLQRHDRCFISSLYVSMSRHIHYWAKRPLQTPVSTHITSPPHVYPSSVGPGCHRNALVSTWYLLTWQFRYSSVAVALQTCRELSQPGTAWHGRSQPGGIGTVNLILVTLGWQHTPVSAHGVLGRNYMWKHGWMSCPHD